MVSLNVLDKQLLKVESLTNPLSYYGGYKNAGLHISYISDIHLLHHQNENHSLNFLIHNTVKQLYKTMDKEGIILFDGDVSSDTNTTIEFFKQFVKYTDLNKYRSAKKDVQFIQDKSQQIIKLTEYIYILKSRLLPHLDFENVSDYKDRYHMSKSWLETIRAYKKVKSYTSKNISDRIDTVTYYYSLLFGFVQSLPSFENVIASIKEKDVDYFPYKRNYELIQQKYNDNKQNPNYILGQTNNDFLLESPGFSSQNTDTIRNHNQLQEVSRSGGMYAISRKINPLQKLFSGHVLRAFDLSLIESVEKQETQIM